MATVIFYGSYLVFPFLGLLIWFWLENVVSHWLIVVLAILSLLFIYSRFVERQLILVREHGEGDIRVAVVSDVHIGTYKSPKFLERVVEKINEAKPDIVLLPGDFVYRMNPDDLVEAMKPLAKLEAPAYGVLGNHDLIPSGEFTQEQMYKALSPHIEMIDNRYIQLQLAGKELTIIGLGDLWSGEPDYNILADVEGENKIVMMHNPDTIYNFPTDMNTNLIVAGHAHGGQIRIPFLYKYTIPTEHPFDEGWYEINGNKMFLTSGLGEVILPMRFMVPPVIDIIKLEL